MHKVYNIYLMKQLMTPQDFKVYSQQEHLKTLSNVRKEAKIEADKLIVDYGYDTDEDYSTLG